MGDPDRLALSDSLGMATLGENHLDPETYEQLKKFLRSNGLTNTEKIFAEEAAELNFGRESSNSATESTSSLTNDATMNEFANLVDYVERSALDYHKVELAVLLYPVFAHVYIQAIRAGQQGFARALFDRFARNVPNFYEEQISTLSSIKTPMQIQTDELVNALLSNTFLLKISRPVLKQLESFMNKNPHIQEVIASHVTLEAVDQPIRVQSAIASELGGILGQRSKTEKRHKMLYGIIRDELVSIGDKKKQKLKDAKDNKKKDLNAPSSDRIPLPSLPESVKTERRLALKDASTKKTRIGAENPPSVCLYTVLNANNGLCCASISENCAMLALGFGNSTIQVNSLASDELKALKPAKELEQLDNDNDEFFDEMYESAEKTKSIKLLGHSAPVHSVSFSCERRMLLSGSRDSTIRLWNLEMRRNLVIYRTAAPVWQAQFCSRGYYFAAATADQTVSLWATDKVQPLRIFSDAMADVTCLDFHPNCNYIVGGSDDRYVRVWDLLTGTCVRTFSGHKGAVKSVKVSPCGRYLVSASSEGQIAVWDMAQQKLLGTQTCEPTDHNSPIVFSRDASVFVMGTPTYGVSFFSMDTITGGSGASTVTSDMTNEPRFLKLSAQDLSVQKKEQEVLRSNTESSKSSKLKIALMMSPTNLTTGFAGVVTNT